MLYLAQVQRRGGKPKVILSARKRLDNLWAAIAPPEIVLDLPSKYDRYGEGTLLMIEVLDDKQVSSANPALLEIVRLLQDYSTRASKFDTQIKEWRESIAIQGEEFFLRRQMLDGWVGQQQNQALEKAWEELNDRLLELGAKG